ncbi:Uncharacterized protein TCM_016017 [Theobroma cacao]|uniref:Uncharacterized protein n=1 Tax=Theobroma cacao TaxID=3641 RepID=A0A061GBH5_THECC|nr:Uncharacterized protein TCM_016017 [Theobroma cacao]
MNQSLQKNHEFFELPFMARCGESSKPREFPSHNQGIEEMVIVDRALSKEKEFITLKKDKKRRQLGRSSPGDVDITNLHSTVYCLMEKKKLLHQPGIEPGEKAIDAGVKELYIDGGKISRKQKKEWQFAQTAKKLKIVSRIVMFNA